MEVLKKIAALRLPLVLGEGPKTVRLLILGEALEEQEVRELRPFAGPADWLLNDVLVGAGVRRGECRVMNVVPTRPPDNRLDKLWAMGFTKEEFFEWVRGEIVLAKPNCILALGNLALEALTGKKGITEWRGSLLQMDSTKVVASFHPSYVLRLAEKTARKEREGEQVSKYTYGSAKITLVLDAKRALEESESSILQLPTRNLQIAPTLEQVANYLQGATGKLVAIDVETKGRWIDCIGLSHDSAHAICIPRGGPYWGPLEEKVERLLKEWFKSDPRLATQNGSFDWTMLLANGFPVERIGFDTMVAHHLLYAELPHDLHYLTSVYTREPYYKWMLRAADSEEMRWKYNCLDAAVTIEIAEALQREMGESEIGRFFETFSMPLFQTVFKMGLRGVGVDLKAKQRLQKVLAYLITRKKKAFSKLVGREINPASPKQLKEYIYGELKLPPQYKPRSRVVTTDEGALKKLARLKGGRHLGSLLEIRDLAKRKGTYADIKLDFDGRIRTFCSVTGTDTGRLSSKKTYFGTGWNSQNVPPWFRRVVVPGTKRVLVEGDLKFAEALLIAWHARDTNTLAAVRAGEDIYKWHGGRMFGVRPEQIDKAKRDLIKPVILGCGYGLGPGHLAEMLGVSRAEGERLRGLFFQSCPAILEYQADVRQQLEDTRRLVNPFGRARMFFGRMNSPASKEEIYRKGYAFLPQSGCVDYLNSGMLRVDAQLPKGAELLLQVHDAMIVECGLEQEEEVVKLIVEALAVPVFINNEPLVIPVEIKRSEKNWGEMKTVGVFNGGS
ncbi:MAG: hypothetical protein KJ954_14440 [Alphaproteobacteria bacterium]|nr:hypothetical protein [Alphaproteobacteria bacterium]